MNLGGKAVADLLELLAGVVVAARAEQTMAFLVEMMNVEALEGNKASVPVAALVVAWDAPGAAGKRIVLDWEVVLQVAGMAMVGEMKDAVG